MKILSYVLNFNTLTKHLFISELLQIVSPSKTALAMEYGEALRTSEAGDY